MKTKIISMILSILSILIFLCTIADVIYGIYLKCNNQQTFRYQWELIGNMGFIISAMILLSLSFYSKQEINIF